MARPRAETISKEPHSVSLKVLRLSHPALAFQTPLPHETTDSISIPSSASLSLPSADRVDQQFALSHNLSLPPSFGSAYVGETFSCSLSANNEITEATSSTKSVSSIKILAEMQTPTTSVPLTLSDRPLARESISPHLPATSVQNIITFPLREEGTHVLAVNLTYTETTLTPSVTDPTITTPTSSRTRSFRKLYQFPSVPCLSVRTKATELPPISMPDKSAGPYGRINLLRYTLEAQLENVSDGTISLESAVLHAKSPFTAIALNWDSGVDAQGLSATKTPAVSLLDNPENRGTPGESLTRPPGSIDGSSEPAVTRPILPPRDIHQLSYLLTQQPDPNAEGSEELRTMLKRDGRAVLGQLSISWHGSMGERGSLSTGGLMSRRRIGG